MDVVQVEHDDPAAQEAMFRALDAYNDAVSGRPEPGRKIAVLVPGTDRVTAGGIFGCTYYDWLHVQLFALPAGLRCRGLGTGALRAAEAAASGWGCRGAWTEARPDLAAFLVRRGWREFGRLDDGPPGTRLLFLRTDIDRGDVAGPAVTETPDACDRAAIEAAAPRPQRHPLGLLLRDRAGAVEGGLWGWSEQGRLFVQTLFLPERLRGAGLGTELMARATEIARGRGCRAIWLDTFSFQARPFYQRLGFTVFGTLPDYPPGGARYFLVKLQA